MAKLTIQFIPYSEIESLKSVERIKKLLKIVLNNKVVLLQGRLKAEEEARLIEDTMALIEHVRGFKGIELAVLSSKQKNNSFIPLIKSGIAKLLLGNRDAVTVIGPASIVKDIKNDPGKIELFLKK
jgi:hypothetical protein